MPMLNFAMIMAFVTTPVFALLNYILVSKTDLPKALQMAVNSKRYPLSVLFTYLVSLPCLFGGNG